MHFFIVGAPRCGTTALSRYLKAHPGVCFAKPKEPQYFATADLAGLSEADLAKTVRRDYLARFFRPRDPAIQVFGEGSVGYLYSEAAIRAILRWDPGARLIVMLRDPVSLLASYHARLVYLMDETERDFEQAWRLQDARAAGRQIPRTCRDPKLLQYGEVGNLGTYTTRLYELADSTQILPVIHDELKADPGAVYRRVLAFLDLPHDGRSDFPRERAGSGFRSALLQHALQRPPRMLVRRLMAEGGAERRKGGYAVPGGGAGGSDGRAGRRTRGLSPRKLRKRLLAWNTTDRPATPLRPAFAAELRAYFAADIALLGRTIGRDLSHWADGGDPSAFGP